MSQVKKIKLKTRYVNVLKVLGVFACIFLGIFIFYSKQLNDLEKLGYSRIASKKILFSFNKDYALEVGENKTLNAAFESDYYNEKYLDNYTRINYVKHKDLIKNINKLLKLGYSNSDINIILAHGDNASVSRFAERKKIRYLEEFFVVDYAKLDNYDRYVSYSDETGEDEETTVLQVNLNMDIEDYKDPVIVKDFSTDMLINKHRSLEENFKPDSLVKIDKEYAASDDMKSSRIALNAFIKMYKDAKKEGYELIINSAYRSYQDQVDISNTYKDLYGQSYVDKYVAKPGFSEHQTGLCFDIGSRKTNVFANSKEYEWMRKNAYKYGFILRFPKKYENITGFRAEPWHYRYVGKNIAKYIDENNITLEEYYVLFLDK